MQVRFLQQFLKTESAGGLFLLISATLAIILANSPFSTLYSSWAESNVFIVNDVLMAIFFLLVGLELKREWATDNLDLSSIKLPMTAAFGGMLVPALLYLIINIRSNATMVGWPIPVATDIAFALGTLSLFGQRVPSALKVFLMSLAIFDDIGAILLIAILYTKNIAFLYLGLAALTMVILFIFNRLRISLLLPYLVVGSFLWYTFLKSGIHPTIAGVLLAFFIPYSTKKRASMLPTLEKRLHPFVVFGIMPLFAFCNAGFPVSLTQLAHSFENPVILGIIAGLFLGKQLGVFGFSCLFIRAGFASLPKQTNWFSLYGVSLLCGIGFTMSLFLGTLSFSGAETAYLADVRIGVITGSVLSGIVGAIVLKSALLKQHTRNIS